MANVSLNDLASARNQQIQFQEHIHEQLLKAKAIANVALSDDFLDYNHSTVHAYLWALADMVNTARNMHEQALNCLLKE